MGIDPTFLTAKQLDRMTPEERKSITGDPRTAAENQAVYRNRREKAEQDAFEAWLKINEIPHIRPPMHRKSQLPKGWPDFTILSDGKGLCVEMKLPGNDLGPDQIKMLAVLALAGVPTRVCYSAQEAIEFTRGKLGLL